MGNRKPLTDEEGEVRELTAEDFRHFKPASSLPPALARKLGVRGPQKEPTKERITICISRDVLETFRSCFCQIIEDRNSITPGLREKLVEGPDQSQ